MKRRIVLALTAAMILGLTACGSSPASDQPKEQEEVSQQPETEEENASDEQEAAPGETPVTMKLGWAETAERSGHALSEAAYTFKEQVEELSGGTVTVELYPAAQLGDASSMLTQVESGTLEACMSISNGQFATSYYPDLGFLDIPYLFESGAEAYELLDPEGEFFAKLQADITEKTGIRPLVFFNEGLRHITNSKKPVLTPEDLKGLKIRTMNVAAHMKMFETLGAQPTNVSWNELYTALQTGAVEGQENPIANAVYISAWEVQKYMTLDGHVCLCGLFCMNEDFYGSLSDAQKAAVDEAARKSLEAEYGMYKEKEAENLALLKEKGLEVTELSTEEIDAFRQACQGEVLEYLRTVMDTPELLDEAMERVEEIRR